jgi:hypothetical protein
MVILKQSEVFTGMKVGTGMYLYLPLVLVTTDFTFMGKDLAQTGVVEYFTTPTAASTTGLLTAVQGAVLINGSSAACITDASVSCTLGL